MTEAVVRLPQVRPLFRRQNSRVLLRFSQQVYGVGFCLRGCLYRGRYRRFFLWMRQYIG